MAYHLSRAADRKMADQLLGAQHHTMSMAGSGFPDDRSVLPGDGESR